MAPGHADDEPQVRGGQRAASLSPTMTRRPRDSSWSAVSNRTCPMARIRRGMRLRVDRIVILIVIVRTSVTIGQALQPFPRSKRSMRLSPHCAFQVGPDTHEGQTRGCPRGGAPAGQAYRHLLSSLHLFAPLFKDIPWRTFTLSVPLQDGIWLLRRLRPLSRPLAFSRPRTGQSGMRFPQFQTKKF